MDTIPLSEQRTPNWWETALILLFFAAIFGLIIYLNGMVQ